MVAPKDMSLEPVNVGGKDVYRCNKVKDLQVGPKSKGRYPYKKREKTTQTHRGGHLKVEAETGGCHHQEC